MNAFKNYKLDRPMLFSSLDYTEKIDKCVNENTVEDTELDNIYDILSSIPKEQEVEYNINNFNKGYTEYVRAFCNTLSSILKGDFSKGLNMYVDEIYTQGGGTVSEELNEWAGKVLSYQPEE